MGRHLGMFPTRSEVAGTLKHHLEPSIDASSLTPDQLRPVVGLYSAPRGQSPDFESNITALRNTLFNLPELIQQRA